MNEDMSYEWKVTVSDGSSEETFGFQALNSDDFDRWVSLFAERTGRAVLDHEKKVIPWSFRNRRTTTRSNFQVFLWF
jgi:hypothetical protein